MVPDDTIGEVKTAHTIFGIVETLQELESARVTEVANEMGMANSTVHNHLSTLERLEYVVKEDQEYKLSLKFLDKGMYAQEKVPLAKFAKPMLDQLAEDTKEVAWLYTEQHGRGILLDNARGSHAVEMVGRIGLRFPLHAHAGGKAILAFLPRDRVNQIINEHGLPNETEKTITDREELYDELKRIQERGIATNYGESVERGRAVAAPILSEQEVLGAIGVAGPESRFTREHIETELSDIILGSANELELKWKYNS